MRNPVLKSIYAPPRDSVEMLSLGVEAAALQLDDALRDGAHANSAVSTLDVLVGLESIADEGIRDQAAGAVFATFAHTATGGEVALKAEDVDYHTAVAGLENVVSKAANAIGSALRRAWEYLKSLVRRLIDFIKGLFGVKKEKAAVAQKTAAAVAAGGAAVTIAPADNSAAADAGKPSAAKSDDAVEKVAVVKVDNVEVKVDAEIAETKEITLTGRRHALFFKASRSTLRDLAAFSEEALPRFENCLKAAADAHDSFDADVSALLEASDPQSVIERLKAKLLSDAARPIKHGIYSMSLVRPEVDALTPETDIVGRAAAWAHWLRSVRVETTPSNDPVGDEVKIPAAVAAEHLSWWLSHGESIGRELEKFKRLTDSAGMVSTYSADEFLPDTPRTMALLDKNTASRRMHLLTQGYSAFTHNVPLTAIRSVLRNYMSITNYIDDLTKQLS